MPKQKQTLHSAGAVWRPESGTLVEWDPHWVVVTRPWPNPQAWRKPNKKDGKWLNCRGAVYSFAWLAPRPRAPGSVRPRPEHPAVLARVAAWKTVPEPVQRAAEGISPRREAWSALSLLARCPGALELAASVPLLACALSIGNAVRPLRVTQLWRSTRLLLTLPDGMARWRKIAAWLGFDGSKSFVNLLRRMETETHSHQWDADSFATLRAVWNNPLGRKRLCHAQQVDHAVVATLGAAVSLGVLERLPSAYFDAAFSGGGPSYYGWALQRAVSAWRALRPGRIIPAWATVEEMEAEHERLRAEARRLYANTQPVALPSFPRPPFEGTAEIRPLTSTESLRAEGAAMQHCIGNASWDRMARFRRGYGYAVHLRAERATLWLARNPERITEFAPTEFRGPKNTPPSKEIVRLVAQWLDGHRDQNWLPPDWTIIVMSQPERTGVPPEIAALLDDEDIPF